MPFLCPLSMEPCSSVNYDMKIINLRLSSIEFKNHLGGSSILSKSLTLSSFIQILNMPFTSHDLGQVS